jgi:hypothetical protein
VDGSLLLRPDATVPAKRVKPRRMRRLELDAQLVGKRHGRALAHVSALGGLNDAAVERRDGCCGGLRILPAGVFRRRRRRDPEGVGGIAAFCICLERPLWQAVEEAGLFLVAADVVVLRAHETGRVAVTLALAATALGARLFGALTAFGARELSSGIWLHD